MTRLFRLALEEESAGNAVKEIEHVLYARLENFRPLIEQSSGCEYHEQWEVKVAKSDDNAGSGKIRIRQTVMPGGEAQYVITTKVKLAKQGDNNANVEVSVPTTAENFLQFQVLADTGMKKMRFFFPIEGSDKRWEVDMFVKDPLYTPEECFKGGTTIFHEWCKIDLEVADKAAPIPKLPFEVAQLIAAPYGERSAEEEAIVQGLYDSVITLKNRFK